MAEKSKPAPTPRKGVNTRITDDLRAKLEAAARENNRTVGNEIETRLTASFASQDQRAMMREVVAEALAERDARKAVDAYHRAAGGGQRGVVIHTGRTIGA